MMTITPKVPLRTLANSPQETKDLPYPIPPQHGSPIPNHRSKELNYLRGFPTIILGVNTVCPSVLKYGTEDKTQLSPHSLLQHTKIPRPTHYLLRFLRLWRVNKYNL
uniref:Retrovirus-related Pol polyprotein from transposon 17.6 n=1 Tax=Schistocephalus solidus TaxID=70667 RepID=A0A0V0JAH3_SCHSO